MYTKRNLMNRNNNTKQLTELKTLDILVFLLKYGMSLLSKTANLNGQPGKIFLRNP